uniref:DNA ligase 4 n=1 Tax=Anopheles atroparvus TaxID=41427 RepID=A0A182J988_ANOAO
MDQFHTIVALLQSISSNKSAQGKEDQLRKFFSAFERHRRDRHGAREEVSIYPVLRLLLPGLDRERKAYGLREKMLADAYVRALALERTSKDGDAARLLSGRGDLSDRLVSLLRGRCTAAQSSLTVAEVNRRLDALAERAGVGVQDELSYLIEHGTPFDHRWFVRIVLRNLRLGSLSGRRILQLYDPNAPALYDTTGDLRHVVQLLEQSPAGDETVATLLAHDGSGGAFVRLGHFIRPMLCQRLELSQVGELLARHTFWLETKLDGERFQVHKDGARFRYLSRNGVDYSATFGTTAEQVDGTLTPMLTALLAETVRTVILDGEMMVFDRRTLRYRDKCDGGADVKALRAGNGELRACFCVYDVLLLNGRVLTALPYGERARLLGTLMVREQLGYVVRCRRERVRDREHLVALLNGAIDAQQEGVVLKCEDAPYQPNRRAGSGWYKIKPDYIAGLVTDFDMLILGGYYNSHRTAVNVFVVGASTEDPDGRTRRFLAVVKVSMGLSATQWTELNRSLRPHWHEPRKNAPEEEDGAIRWGRAGPPDVCIEPSASIVLQLKGSELVRSDTYAAGYTIRFPRIVAIRSDKQPDEVCTLAELEQLVGRLGKIEAAVECASQSLLGADTSRKATKLAKRHVTLEDLAPRPRAEAGGGRSRRRQLTIVTTGTGSSTSIVGEGILRGRDICVMGGIPGSAPIRELEALVGRHGGRAVANPGPGTFAIVVTGPATFKVRKYRASGRWDMVSADWLLRTTADTVHPLRLEPFRPSEMLACTEATRLALAEAYDRYGDSYTRPVSPTSFAALLRHDAGGAWRDVRLSERELILAERTLLGAGAQIRWRLFRGRCARLYLPRPAIGPPDKRNENEAETMPDLFVVEHMRAQREMLRFVRHGGRWLRDTEPGAVAYIFLPTTATGERTTSDVSRWLRTIERMQRQQREGEDELPEQKLATSKGNLVEQEDKDEERRAIVLRTEWIGKSLERGQLCAVTEYAFNDDD